MSRQGSAFSRAGHRKTTHRAMRRRAYRDASGLPRVTTHPLNPSGFVAAGLLISRPLGSVPGMAHPGGIFGRAHSAANRAHACWLADEALFAHMAGASIGRFASRCFKPPDTAEGHACLRSEPYWEQPLSMDER